MSAFEEFEDLVIRAQEARAASKAAADVLSAAQEEHEKLRAAFWDAADEVECYVNGCIKETPGA